MSLLNAQSRSPVIADRGAGRLKDTRLAWIIWGIFALAIVGDTWRRADLVELNDGTRLQGRVRSHDADALRMDVRRVTRSPGLDAQDDTESDAKQDDSGGRNTATGERTLALRDVLEIAPFGSRSVTPEYRRAAERWFASPPSPLYSGGIHGFLYLPQAAIIFAPFAMLPAWLGEVLWRWAGLALYAAGVYSVCRSLARSSGSWASKPPSHAPLNQTHSFLSTFPNDAFPSLFALTTLLSIPSAFGSASDGQTNLAMGGLFALACVAAAGRRWWWCSLWLMLALAAKPVSIVIVLLIAAVYPRSIPRLLIGVAALALIPFAHPNPSYVLHEYGAAISKIMTAAQPDAARFLDQGIGGLLNTVGVSVPLGVMTGVRAVLAIATLGAVWFARRRFGDPIGAMYLLALGTLYIVLMNPRTEGLGYVVIGVAAGLWAAAAYVRKRLVAGVLLTVFCLLLQFSRVITNGPNYWVRPATSLGFLACVLAPLVRRTTGKHERPSDQQHP